MLLYTSWSSNTKIFSSKYAIYCSQ